MNMIVTETNRYGNDYIKYWYDTDKLEMIYWIGMFVLISLSSPRFDLQLLWSKDWKIRREEIVKRFPRNPFFNIKSTLHLIYNDILTTEEKKNNKIYKFGNLFQLIIKNSSETRNLLK